MVDAIQTVLVANRGEIARRIFRTCRDLGLSTVAVYSDADETAPHTREADAAVRLPGRAAADTYLRADLVVRAALAAGADAVHPGYGFLSEDPGFARAVRDAGLTWIGPPPEAIEAMASKTRAKALMAAAGVPLLADLDPAEITGADLPVLVKAAAGGGGRGMRVVREAAALAGELAAAAAEAAAAFGDGEVFVEPYLELGRHVEVQLLADGHGTVWALGTRDCSLQRRHQKVIEEAPAPALGAALDRTLRDAATAAARAVGYRGAGTVEFLVAGDRPYFLEMNTRLQVEHPVTEAVYGLDLVAWQIRIAEGRPLPEADPPRPAGHAVEARLYAEDPGRGWRPQTGVLHRLEIGGTPEPGAPATGGDSATGGGFGTGGPARGAVRVDAGYGADDEIGPYYDPMLAKVIAWAATRDEAVRILARTLERARIHGPVTNRDLLVRSLRHPDFAAARLDTGFYERHLERLTAPHPGDTGLAALAAALADAAAATRAGGTAARLGAWRNLPAQPQSRSYRVEPSGEVRQVRYHLTRRGLAPADGSGTRVVEATGEVVRLEAGGVVRAYRVSRYGDRVHVDGPAGAYALTALPRFPDPEPATAPGSLLAPMPGTVVRIADGLAEGDRVRQGRPLLWLEAMKMEHRITAPASGTLTALHATPGRQVEVGALLAVVEPDESVPPRELEESG
ncbi:biotin carboxylase N-terminal domain-containing protein [Streptomyces sp. NPDC018031]|uniref:ATP-binding protein n=1 Tax=Streptomyces sp. NPDC018031 TaxID=3365033 RepID=UPI0037A6F633